MEIATGICVGCTIIVLVLFLSMLKLYTEYFKDMSANRRIKTKLEEK